MKSFSTVAVVVVTLLAVVADAAFSKSPFLGSSIGTSSAINKVSSMTMEYIPSYVASRVIELTCSRSVRLTACCLLLGRYLTSTTHFRPRYIYGCLQWHDQGTMGGCQGR